MNHAFVGKNDHSRRPFCRSLDFSGYLDQQRPLSRGLPAVGNDRRSDIVSRQDFIPAGLGPSVNRCFGGVFCQDISELGPGGQRAGGQFYERVFELGRRDPFLWVLKDLV